MHTHLNYAWDVPRVFTDNGSIKIDTALPRLTDKMYYPMVQAACIAVMIDENDDLTQELPDGVVEFVFRNKSGVQGWVYESPERCPEIVKTSGSDVQMLIATATHTL